MSKRKKLLKKFLERPVGLTFAEIQVLLFSVGFNLESVSGSHHKFYHSYLKKSFTIPIHHGDCKNSYKIYILKFITSNNIHIIYSL